MATSAWHPSSCSGPTMPVCVASSGFSGARARSRCTTRSLSSC